MRSFPRLSAGHHHEVRRWLWSDVKCVSSVFRSFCEFACNPRPTAQEGWRLLGIEALRNQTQSLFQCCSMHFVTFAAITRFCWSLNIWRGLFSVVGPFPRPAQSLPAKLVSEHVVRKGCVSGNQSRANQIRRPAYTVPLVYYRIWVLIGWKVGKIRLYA